MRERAAVLMELGQMSVTHTFTARSGQVRPTYLRDCLGLAYVHTEYNSVGISPLRGDSGHFAKSVGDLSFNFTILGRKLFCHWPIVSDQGSPCAHSSACACQ